ncbi:glycosyltransferase [Flavobacterium oreochromis]|uniref:glycosyltransferase family 4 protein n=1 Tax=Flavobacterium oreochromis TaxID=2906078 RepID=UPI00385EDCCD
MHNKKTILMICSWLDFKKNIGVFFWEQAYALSNDYIFILCFFNKKKYKLKDIFKYKKTEIKNQKIYNFIDCYSIEYNNFLFLPNFFNSFLLKRSIKKFKRKLKNEAKHIDLIHAQSLFNAGINAYHYQQKTNIPYIITEHDQITLLNKTKLDLKYGIKAFENSKEILVVSSDKIRQFATNNFFRDTFLIVGNSIDSKIFFQKEIKTNDKNFVITTVGAYSLQKDHKTLFNALKILDKHKYNQKIIFKWIGFNGWGVEMNEYVNNLIKEYNLKNIQIELFPLLGRNELANLLQHSDLFVFSSLVEGMPVSVLEALACGIPVVTTQCGGVEEIINDENGILVQVKDYVNLAKSIDKCIKKEIIFDNKKISKNILDRFENKAFANNLKKIYSDVIKNN